MVKQLNHKPFLYFVSFPINVLFLFQNITEKMHLLLSLLLSVTVPQSVFQVLMTFEEYWSVILSNVPQFGFIVFSWWNWGNAFWKNIVEMKLHLQSIKSQDPNVDMSFIIGDVDLDWSHGWGVSISFLLLVIIGILEKILWDDVNWFSHSPKYF